MADPPPYLRIARDASLPEFLRAPSVEIRQALDNDITRALAGSVAVRPDGWHGWGESGLRPVTRAEVVGRALSNLLNFDLVGFADRLDALPHALVSLRPDMAVPASSLPRLNAAAGEEADLVAPQSDPMIVEEVERELDRLTEFDRFVVDRAREMLLPGEGVARPASLRVARWEG